MKGEEPGGLAIRPVSVRVRAVHVKLFGYVKREVVTALTFPGCFFCRMWSRRVKAAQSPAYELLERTNGQARGVWLRCFNVYRSV